MKKWYAEEYEFQIEVTGVPPWKQHRALLPERREKIGDQYACTYGCPVNGQGEGVAL